MTASVTHGNCLPSSGSLAEQKEGVVENLLEESVLSEIIQFGHHLKVALGAEAVEARGLTDAQCRDITESALRIQKALHPPTNALDSSGTE